ncbi:MAG: hypothetical protein AB1659_12685 [Thermodesulfobacteriota bacterium]
MSALEHFEQSLTRSERKLVSTFTTPYQIQKFLDTIHYSSEEIYRSPLRVLKERIGHCFDGALFAAALFRRIGYPSLILDMLPSRRDDDHLLALYRINGYWGAVAKSNFSGLRYREPIFRNLRELVLSYFEQYFNLAREKTLRGYTRPLDLKSFDRYYWMTRDEPLELIADHLDSIRRFSLLTRSMISRLSPVDDRSYKTGLMGADRKGLFKLKGSSSLD